MTETTTFQEKLEAYREKYEAITPPAGFFRNHPAYVKLQVIFWELLKSDVRSGKSNEYGACNFVTKDLRSIAGGFACAICAQASIDKSGNLQQNWLKEFEMREYFAEVKECWLEFSQRGSCKPENRMERHLFEMKLRLLSPLSTDDPEIKLIIKELCEHAFTEEETNTTPSEIVLNQAHADWMRNEY
jgi:hypothetical protein